MQRIDVIDADGLDVHNPSRGSVKFQRHEHTVWIGKIAPEGWALDKPMSSVECARGNKIRPRPGLTAQTRQSHLSRPLHDVQEHRAAGAISSLRLLGVH